jgi:thiamine biosynthesis lipoprotein
MEEKAIEAPFIGRFEAMSCPCEILLDTADAALLEYALNDARQEAERIESRYSRYRADSILSGINAVAGKKVDVDPETASLLDYADRCYRFSEGLFDITTGVLRHGADISHVGWDRVTWQKPFLQLPAGFEIDFGGICKEYAADRILALLRSRYSLSTLVNLGGDLAAAGRRLWWVGIESSGAPDGISKTLPLRQGAMATSGTTHRGGHILDPKTGRAVLAAPQSVTVRAATCTEAGFWSTWAMLLGPKAETLLKAQGIDYWISGRVEAMKR